MSLDGSVPRAADAQEELHESVEQLGLFTDLLAEARRDFPEVESVRSDYDRFANGVADYMENEAGDIQGYLGELMSHISIGEGRRNFMSPTYNFGVMEEQPDGSFMSPTYNFGAMGGNLDDVFDDWEEVEEDSGDDEWMYADSSQPIIYNPQIVTGRAGNTGEPSLTESTETADYDAEDWFDGDFEGLSGSAGPAAS